MLILILLGFLYVFFSEGFVANIRYSNLTLIEALIRLCWQDN